MGMAELTENKVFWWSSASLRISYPSLEPDELSLLLNAIPAIADRPGQSRVRHGSCDSAGYWCVSHREGSPARPSVVIEWAETFVADRIETFSRFVEIGYDINVYVAIHSNVMSVGFDLPSTPALTKLGIRVGIEYFSR